MIKIKRTNIGIRVYGVVFGVLVVILAACAQNRAVLPQKRNILFCTTETERVHAKLLGKQGVRLQADAEEVWITGKLFFDDLSGWYTQEPVPSYSRLTGDQNAKDLYDQHPRIYDAYWTGNLNSPCVIPTRVILRGTQGMDFDIDKLSLVYHSSKVVNNMLLGPDSRENIKYFRLSYNRLPLEISAMDIVRLPGAGIAYGIEIRAGFPSQPARRPED